MYTLPRADQQLLIDLGYKEKLEEVDKAILVNAVFLEQIVANTEIFEHEPDEDNTGEHDFDAQQSRSGSSRSHAHSHGRSFV